MKKKNKKVMALALAAAMTASLALTGCGGKRNLRTEKK